ncbi:MAG: acyl-CoA dehydrogenase family protein [Thermaurantiacus sp.]
MDFDLSDDAKTLREAARKFLDAEAGPAKARAVMEGDQPHDFMLWDKVVEQGWPAARVPEAHGGLGLGTDEACVLAEEVGRSLAPVPLLATMDTIEALRVAGTEAQQATWLPKLASGAAVGVVAWGEGDAKSPAQMPRSRLEGGRLAGVKSPVQDGLSATVAVVTVASADGPSMAIVDLSADGVAREPVDALDLVRKSARITFDGAAAEPLGDATHWVLLTERLAVLRAWEALGTADAAMRMTLDYAKDRQAFGLRIGRYQAVKHKLADMYIKGELARAHAMHGCWAWGSGAPELAQAAAAARVASLDALAYTAEESLQLHGGIGFTWEHDCQFFYRRARAVSAALGSRAHWADRLVRALEQRNRAAA